MLIRYSNFSFLIYLNFYDLINKFNFINFYKIPKCIKISIKFFFRNKLNFFFFNIFLKSFFLLYLFCFKSSYLYLRFKKLRYRKLKSYKANLFLNYYFMKKKIFLTFFRFSFFFLKYIRPFFFSKKLLTFSKYSGKCLSNLMQVIIFIPSRMLLDSKERRFLYSFALDKSKFFLSFSFKFYYTAFFFNFFNKNFNISKNYFQNFLFFWLLI